MIVWTDFVVKAEFWEDRFVQLDLNAVAGLLIMDFGREAENIDC